MVKKMKVKDGFAARFAAVQEQKKGNGPHVKARNWQKAVRWKPKQPIESEQPRQKISRGCQPNIVSCEFDPTFPPKFDSMPDTSTTRNTNIFYVDGNGITMDYPEDTENERYMTLPLSNLEVIENHESRDNFKVIVGHDPNKKEDEKDEKTFVVLKVSANQAHVNPWKMKAHQKVFELLLATMPFVKRGGARSGVESKYICYGHRKNPLDCELGKYTSKPGVSDKVKKKLEKGVGDLVYTIEGRSMKALKRAHLIGEGRDDFERVQKTFNLPSITGGDGVATQLALAKGYCSPVHVDDDYYYSTLSCYDATANKDQVLYHFCFPSYGIAIPMCSGDIILFNPLVLHCATNPTVETAFIYSLYVSNKTCNTYVATKDNKDMV